MNTEADIVTIKQDHFGRLSCGRDTLLFTLTNQHGCQISISNYGAIITSLLTPDSNNQSADIVLGYDSVQAYETDPHYLGAIIGRVAGRIAKGEVVINKQKYQLSLNQADSQLHGGTLAFNKQLWQANTKAGSTSASVILTHTSTDGDNGFPGTVDVTIQYTLTADNELIIEYFAKTDQSTLLNLTQHSYFNLSGHDYPSIEHHQLKLNADHYLPMNQEIYPENFLAKVCNSPYDFRQLNSCYTRLMQEHDSLTLTKGYDNYWLSNDSALAQTQPLATMIDNHSGRKLTLYSDQPCIVFYSGNYLNGAPVGKAGSQYDAHSAFCLEPQRIANKQRLATLDNCLLKPNQPFYSCSKFIFSTIK